jgi:hypothetical protein
MVTVAQSAERQIVDLEVAGSSPVGHPTHPHDAPQAREIRLAGHRLFPQLWPLSSANTPVNTPSLVLSQGLPLC